MCVASFDVTRKERKYEMNQFYIKNASPTQLPDSVGDEWTEKRNLI
jgi:hypothetical protein